MRVGNAFRRLSVVDYGFSWNTPCCLIQLVRSVSIRCRFGSILGFTVETVGTLIITLRFRAPFVVELQYRTLTVMVVTISASLFGALPPCLEPVSSS